MPVPSSPADHVDRARWNVVELLTALRLLGGAALTSLTAAAVLFAPDQVRELYRIAASDGSMAEITLGMGALTLMSFIFYWVSRQITIQCDIKIARDAATARTVLTVVPILIGILPLIAAGFGMLGSRPGTSTVKVSVGSPWQGFAERVSEQLGERLQQGAFAVFGLAVLVGAVAVLLTLYGRRLRAADAEALRRGTGFFGVIGLIVSIGIVVAMTVAVLQSPVVLPQMIGTIPILALFFIAIMLMTGQMTVWQETTGLPFVVLLAAFAIGFSALDLNDNHEIRAVADTQKAAPADKLARMPDNTWRSFEAWYKARPDRDQYKETYPVYIVAAQGGGIYAAYHAATLMARMQDVCPRFQHHLFAVSSVSGGSLGAGVYAAVAKGIAAAPTPPADQGAAAASATEQGATAATPSIANPCPGVEGIGGPRVTDGKPGRHEVATSRILATDFLAPLAASTLFPDFTQRFLPFAVPSFDRARSLEQAFEESWKAAQIPGPNPLEESALKLWSPDGVAPALLINTTESDSGRRLLISPFLVGDATNDGELLQFPQWNYWHSMFHQGGAPCKGRDLPLSSAIGLSARFPWLTPAGSLTTDCNVDRKPIKTRVVDGGYFDNSGVDTAIDVIVQLSEQLKETDFKLDGPGGPRIEFHLIVLTTSEYPQRAGYGLGDGLEPIRALLSARSARTPIAINQAKRRLSILERVAEATRQHGNIKVHLPHIHEARFRDTIFKIPLGWRLSKASREVIDIQSGHFADCDADASHKQRDDELSNADCIQLMVFHQLTESMPERLNLVSLSLNYENTGLRAEIGTVDVGGFLGCYDAALKNNRIPRVPPRHLQRRHARSIEGILRAWNRNQALKNEDWLAFLIAVVDQETGSLPTRYAGCLTEKCVLRRLVRLGDTVPFYKKLLEPNEKGNRFYERGYIQLAGADNYRRLNDILGYPVYAHPDLLLVPQISARALFAWKTISRLGAGTTLDKYTTVAADGTTSFDLPRALGEHMYGPRFSQPNFPASRSRQIHERALPRVKATYDMARACLAGKGRRGGGK